MAPEAVLAERNAGDDTEPGEQPNDDKKIDVWAIGMCVWNATVAYLGTPNRTPP